MHWHFQSHEQPASTEGRLLRGMPYYDTLANIVTLGQIQRLRLITVRLAQIKPGDCVLDVGCGPGSVTIPAKIQAGPDGQVAGIDPSPGMISIAQQKAERMNLEIEFRVGVIESLPYSSDTFDVVTSSLMIQHLPGDLKDRGLAEVYRVLKPGGIVLIADFVRPNSSLASHIFYAFTKPRHLEIGVEDLLGLLKSTGFSRISLLPDKFLVIGFVRAKK